MRIVVDTNIVFSALLNTSSKISFILLAPKSPFNFYSIQLLIDELIEHSERLKEIAGYSEGTFQEILKIYRSRIKFIDPSLIPKSIMIKAFKLTEDIDVDDIELVALTEHAKAKFWSGDKTLIQGLELKGWKKFISTQTLYKRVMKK